MSEDAEKKMYSLTRAQSALNDETGKLMDTMIALNKSKVWTIISRSASGILPNFWAVQNKFRAVTDAFKGYNDWMIRVNESSMKAVEGHKRLTDQMSKIPDELFLLGDDSDELNRFMKVAEEHIEEFQSIKDMVTAAGGGRLQIKREIMSQIKPQQEGLAKRREEMGEAYKKKMEAMEFKESFEKAIEEGRSKDAFSIWFKRRKSQLSAFLKGMLQFLKAAFIWGFGILLGIGLLVALVKDSWPVIQRNWEATKEGFKVLYDGIVSFAQGFIEFMAGAFTGDLERMLEGLGAMFLGVIEIGLGLFTSAISLGFLALQVLLGGIWESIKENGAWSKETLFTIGKTLAIIAGLALLITALPGSFALALASYTGLLVKILVAGIIGMIMGSHAKGGIVKTPMQIVGEKGPELVTLPRGSRVHSNAESRKMMGGNTINVHVNGRVGASDAEIRDIADKVGREINLRMNRTANTQTRF